MMSPNPGRPQALCVSEDDLDSLILLSPPPRAGILDVCNHTWFILLSRALEFKFYLLEGISLACSKAAAPGVSQWLVVLAA